MPDAILGPPPNPMTLEYRAARVAKELADTWFKCEKVTYVQALLQFGQPILCELREAREELEEAIAAARDKTIAAAAREVITAHQNAIDAAVRTIRANVIAEGAAARRIRDLCVEFVQALRPYSGSPGSSSSPQ